MKTEISTDDLIDYPASSLFQEFHEELQGRIFSFIPVDVKPINDVDMEDPHIVDILEALLKGSKKNGEPAS